MSTTALGPILDLDGPLPVAPKHGLLTLPGVDKGNEGAPEEPGDQSDGEFDIPNDDARWQGGVNVYGYPVLTPSLWEPCATGTFRVKDDGGEEPLARFDPVGVYLPITCSTLGISNDRLNVLQDRARAVLEATLSWACERIISQGVAGSNNGFIGDSSFVAPAGGTAVSVQTGIGYLEDALGATGRGGIIHLPPAVTAALGFNYLREVDPDGREDSGDEYIVTAVGTPVATGGGYQGAHPVGSGGLPGPSGTKQWAFVTGPVEVRYTPIMTDDPRAVDHADNTVTLRPELMAVVEWDTALQAGVLIDWSL